MAVIERSAPEVHVVGLPEPWRSVPVTVVLPTYNEASNLPVIVAAPFYLPLNGLRILVADDNSHDGTGRIAEELAVKYCSHRMAVVHRPAKEGLGRTYVGGTTRAIQAGTDFVVQMDSYLSHGPSTCLRCLASFSPLTPTLSFAPVMSPEPVWLVTDLLAENQIASVNDRLACRVSM